MKTTFALPFTLAFLLFTACEDAPPTDYVARPFIQGYLLVGEPIQDIVVALSQPIDQAYDHPGSIVRDAAVTIEYDGRTLPLLFREEVGAGSYHVDDSTVVVLPETTYRLRVRMPDGALVHAETTTPRDLAWVLTPPAFVQYPKDTTRLAATDSLRLRWTPGDNTEFLLRVMVLDTVGYGRYLSPPTVEANARTGGSGSAGGPGSGGGPGSDGHGGSAAINYSVTRWTLVAQDRYQIPWTSFSWYGRHDVAVFAADHWFLQWFKSVQFSRLTPEYDPRESNIVGGLGVFGSAAVLRTGVFVLKNER
ncbi:MAG: hypothetical protein RBU27_12005 [Bacteroidota bacterium]|jgi:hypothetical protein|nr:hypothetical protein [Bacteroidota bacterium]